MLSAYALIELTTVILAFVGIVLIAKIYAAKKGMDIATLKARAFLDESFLKDSWLLLLLICLLFILHAVTELNELFLQIKNPIPTILLKEGTELGILVCTIMLVYKWLRLINPQRG